jgi:hypothetical protein
MSKFAEILASGARHADEVGRDGWTVELRVLPRGIGVSVKRWAFMADGFFTYGSLVSGPEGLLVMAIDRFVAEVDGKRAASSRAGAPAAH